MEIASTAEAILVVSEFGFGKRTLVDEYPVHGRGGSGVRTFNTNPKTGELMAARMVDPSHELMLIAEDGIVLRTPVEHISRQGRSTQGVTLMDTDRDNRDNKIAAVAVIDMERDFGTSEALPTGATVAGEEIATAPAAEETDAEEKPEPKARKRGSDAAAGDAKASGKQLPLTEASSAKASANKAPEGRAPKKASNDKKEK
jgi:DNA gyrase subunit A